MGKPFLTETVASVSLILAFGLMFASAASAQVDPDVTPLTENCGDDQFLDGNGNCDSIGSTTDDQNLSEVLNQGTSADDANIDMSNNGIDNIASLDGGGNAIQFNDDIDVTGENITSTMAANDYFDIYGKAGPGGDNDGRLIIKTRDDGDEPILLQQHDSASSNPPDTRLKIDANGNIEVKQDLEGSNIVNSGNINSGAVSSTEIADGAVGNSQIASSATDSTISGGGGSDLSVNWGDANNLDSNGEIDNIKTGNGSVQVGKTSSGRLWMAPRNDGSEYYGSEFGVRNNTQRWYVENGFDIENGDLDMNDNNINNIGGLQNCNSDEYVGGDGNCKTDQGATANKDLTTSGGLTGGENDVLVGSDSDVDVSISDNGVTNTKLDNSDDFDISGAVDTGKALDVGGGANLEGDLDFNNDGTIDNVDNIEMDGNIEGLGVDMTLGEVGEIEGPKNGDTDLNIQTQGSGSHVVSIEDGANSNQDIARFNEGGNVEIPNGALNMKSNSLKNVGASSLDMSSGNINFNSGGSLVSVNNLNVNSINSNKGSDPVDIDQGIDMDGSNIIDDSDDEVSINDNLSTAGYYVSNTTGVGYYQTLGDANGDGIITGSDAWYLYEGYQGNVPCPKTRCDINNDGTVDFTDVNLLNNVFNNNNYDTLPKTSRSTISTQSGVSFNVSGNGDLSLNPDSGKIDATSDNIHNIGTSDFDMVYDSGQSRMEMRSNGNVDICIGDC